MKKILLGLVGGLGLVIVALLLAPLLLPADTVRARIADSVRAATGRELTIDGDVSLRLLPAPSFHAAGISLANAGWSKVPAMARVKSVAVDLRLLPLLSGRFEVARLHLTAPDIALETGPDGKGNWVFDAPAPPGAAATSVQDTPGGPARSASNRPASNRPAAISLADVRIEGGRASFQDQRSGSRQTLEGIDIALSLPGLDQKLTASGSATWNGEAMRLSIDADAPGTLLAGGEGAITLRLESAPLRLAFEGRLLGLPPRRTEGSVDITSPSLRRLITWTGGTAALPGTQPGALAIKGHVVAEGNDTRFSDASIAFDAIRAAGALTLTTGASRPLLAGALTAGVVDLNPYLTGTPTRPATAPPAARPAPAAASDGWSDAPIDLSALAAADITLDLAAEQIIHRSLRIDRPRLALALRDARLTADLRELTLYRGQGKARLDLESQASPPSLSLSLSLTGTDIEGLLDGAIGFDRLSGTGHVTLDVTSRGASQRALIAALAGKGALNLADGRIKGVDLLGIARKALPGGGGDTGGSTGFGSLAGTFTITNGILDNEDMTLKSGPIPLTGAGHVDLPARMIDYRVVAQIAGAIKIPVNITGPWDHISYQPDGGKALEQFKPSAPGNLLRGLLPKP